jgi:hypothetical protein
MSLKSKANSIPAIILSLLLVGMFIISGCSKEPAPVTSGGGTGTADVNLTTPTVAPSNIETNGTAVVEVIATDASSEPIADLSVDFIVSPSSGGYFTPPTALTDENGIASAIFTASQTGTLSIAASTDNAMSPYTSVSVSSNQQSSGNMDISVTPSLLSADGISSATVSITVQNSDGQYAPDSTLVKITAGERFVDVDGNGYFSNGDSLTFDYNANETWDPVGFIPSTAYTQSGVATVTYTSGTEATTAYIRATVMGTVEYDGFVETSVQLTPNAEIYAIELSSDVTGLQVRHTGGIETTNMDAICYDVHGNFVPEGIPVTFTITDGPDGGENIAGQGYGPVVAYTNANGVATVPVWSGTVSGTIRMYASAGSVLSTATFLAVYAGPPYYLGVGSDFCNMDGWNTINREMYVNATLSDYYHNPVQDSVAVYFTVDEGIIDAYGITADSTGVASAIFRTGPPQVDGVVWIWAETSGGTVVGSTFFYNSFIPANIYLAMSPQHLLATGESYSTFWADVRDLNNNFVLDGTEVESKALYGTPGSGATEDGCNASVFEGTYYSKVLKQDFSVTGADDDGIGAIDIITVKSGFVASNVVCTLLTSTSYYDESSLMLDASSVSYGAAGIPIRALIKDRYGNPLADHTLTASISAGSIVPGTAVQETNEFGEAFGFQFNAPADSTGGKTAVISIADGDARGNNLTMTATVTYTAKKK